MKIYLYKFQWKCNCIPVWKTKIYIYMYIYININNYVRVCICISINAYLYWYLWIYTNIDIWINRYWRLSLHENSFNVRGFLSRKICLIAIRFNMIGKGHGMMENEIFFMASVTENKKQQEVKPKPHHRQAKNCKPIRSHPSELRCLEHFQQMKFTFKSKTAVERETLPVWIDFQNTYHVSRLSLCSCNCMVKPTKRNLNDWQTVEKSRSRSESRPGDLLAIHESKNISWSYFWWFVLFVFRFIYFDPIGKSANISFPVSPSSMNLTLTKWRGEERRTRCRTGMEDAWRS